MRQTATTIPGPADPAAEGREDRLFMRLLLGAGIAAGAAIGYGLVWNHSDLGIAPTPAHQADSLPVGH